MEPKTTYSLKEISEWTKEGSNVIIPSIQRGLVWKPHQVELLWDSILRGFPIGSFMFAETTDKQRYDLLDGQQRYNAISLAYDNNPNSILWIDIKPEEISSSTRKFWLRVTNTAHPWGFKKDDTCSILNTAERRDAIKVWGLKGDIYNDSFDLFNTWPVNANCPIPFNCVINASKESPEEFFEDIKNSIKNYRNKTEMESEVRSHWGDVFNELENNSYIKETLFPAIKNAEKYKVSCDILKLEVFKKESETNNGEEKTTLEVLFERINVNGTRISKDDLQYSSIKAYWKDIKETNDKLAKKYMSPSKLVMLVFRMALTEKGSKKLYEPLTIKQIRDLAKNEKIKRKITEYYKSENGEKSKIEEILEKVDEWLGVTGEDISRTPAFLRTSMAYKTPELYLLLMYWARLWLEDNNSVKLTTEQIRAFAFTVRWFSKNYTKNDYKKIVNKVFSTAQENISINLICQSLMMCMWDSNLLHIYSPEEFKEGVKIPEPDKKDSLYEESAPQAEFIKRIMTAYYNSDVVCEMLLYAQRKYINSHFKNYDPARKDMWESYNRPWDYDHIIARDRIDNKQGKYREYCKKWLNTIGNIAAISYVSNREKGAKDNAWGEYEENKDSLMFDDRFKDLTKDLTKDSNSSSNYAKLCWKRLNKIYIEVYELMKPVLCHILSQDFGTDVSLPEQLKTRKNIMMEICERIKAEVYFVSEDQEYPLKRPQDWCRKWICAEIRKDNYSVCFAWDAHTIAQAQIGIRKIPKTEIKGAISNEIKDNYPRTSNWWYARKELTNINIDKIVEELEDLNNTNIFG